MFRSSDDSALTYSTDDLVLFRESPFAAWMERLTLENPDHGIIADADILPQANYTESLEDIVTTLRTEGRNVVVIDQDIEAPEQALSTEVAMRSGADFIVNAHLVEGSLAATAGLLMRTSGFSDLGDYLYIPCEARPLDLRHSSFRLCVLADLLQVVQGQLPPQLLIISGGADLTPLQTEDHIYYYRSVKARFLEAMAEFRKHRMPDPAESTFFGRWSACAGEVLKQRAQRDQAQEQDPEQEQEQQQAQEDPVVIEEIVVELPKVQMVGGAPQSFYTPEQDSAQASVSPRIEEAPVSTLAEQASMLQPGSFSQGRVPGHTPNLSGVAPLRAVTTEAEAREETAEEGAPIAQEANAASIPAGTATAEPEAQSSTAESVVAEEADQAAQEAVKAIVSGDAPARPTADSTLENLEFIGSAPASLMGPEPLIDVTVRAGAEMHEPPDPALGLRESFEPDSPWPKPDNRRSRLRTALPDLEPPEPALLPPEPNLTDHATALPHKTHPLDSGAPVLAGSSMIDMDGAPPPALSPVSAGPGNAGDGDDALARPSAPLPGSALPADDFPRRQFSNSLQTGSEFEDSDEP